MRWLIEQAGEDGREAWIQQCLALPQSSGQEAVVGASTAADRAWNAAAEAGLTVGDIAIWEPVLHQEEDQADPQEEVLTHRRKGGFNPALGNESAKRILIPHRKHSPTSPP